VGKTSLVNLIPRFYDVAGGQVLVDGIDVRQVTLASLRSQIGIVPQETVLFAMSVAENIAYGRLNAEREEIISSAKSANAHQFISGLHQGYETYIGERGAQLSGGERQRLAIARAILSDPRILILDEATSNLDAESEKLIQEAIGRLISDRTTFIIAHRLSTVRRVDRILVLSEGRIVEEGNHESLLSRGGVYEKLCQAQFQS
jgi:ABC-type multidrug transport system fused ATPase/permease subunit